MPVKSQFAFGPSLYAGIEFSESGTPARWWLRIREQVAIVAAPAAFELSLAYGAGRLRVLRV
jgi:hypothetical protein